MAQTSARGGAPKFGETTTRTRMVGPHACHAPPLSSRAHPHCRSWQAGEALKGGAVACRVALGGAWAYWVRCGLRWCHLAVLKSGYWEWSCSRKTLVCPDGKGAPPRGAAIAMSG